jgi:hypothetical protein
MYDEYGDDFPSVVENQPKVVPVSSNTRTFTVIPIFNLGISEIESITLNESFIEELTSNSNRTNKIQYIKKLKEMYPVSLLVAKKVVDVLWAEIEEKELVALVRNFVNGSVRFPRKKHLKIIYDEVAKMILELPV